MQNAFPFTIPTLSPLSNTSYHTHFFSNHLPRLSRVSQNADPLVITSYEAQIWKLNVLASCKLRNTSNMYTFVAMKQRIQVFLCRNVPVEGELLQQLPVELNFAKDVAQHNILERERQERHIQSTSSSRRSSVGSGTSTSSPAPPPSQRVQSPPPPEDQEINYIRVGKFNNEPVLLVCGQGKVALYHINNLTQAPIILQNGDDALEDTSTWSVACANNLIIAGSNAHKIGLWHRENLGTRRVIAGCKHNVPCVDLSQNENYIAAASIDSRLRIWRVINSQSAISATAQPPLTQLVASTRPSGQWGWFVRFIPESNFVRIPDDDEFWTLTPQRDERILQTSLTHLSDEDDDDDEDEDDDMEEAHTPDPHHHEHVNDEDFEEIDSPNSSRAASSGTFFAVDEDTTISMSPSSSRGAQHGGFPTTRPTSAPPFRRTSSILERDTDPDSTAIVLHSDTTLPTTTTSGRSTPVHRHQLSSNILLPHQQGTTTPSVTSQDDQTTYVDENVSTWTQVPSSEHEDGTNMSIVTIKSDEQQSVRLEENRNHEFLLYCDKNTIYLFSPSLQLLDEFFYRPRRLHFAPILHALSRLVFVEYIPEFNLVLCASQADTCVLLLRIARNHSGTQYRFVEERILGYDERNVGPICGMTCEFVGAKPGHTPSGQSQLFVFTLHLDGQLRIHTITLNDSGGRDLRVERLLV